MSNKKNLKKNIKKLSQGTHFSIACLERVGMILDHDYIVRKIQNKELEFVDKQSNRITRWKYKVNDKEYILVYDKDRKQLVTIIPYKEGMEKVSIKDTYYWWCK